MRREEHEDFAASPAASAGSSSGMPDEDVPLRSLLADFEALTSDARSWFDAEIGFQKCRASYVLGRAKLLAGLGLGVLFFLVMALFGLVVGLIVALTPLITAWGATGVVVGGLLLGAFVMVRKASGVWRAMMDALEEQASETDG